jgi:hypothetical protein
MRHFSLLLLFLFALTLARAATPAAPVDLGEGLSYLRIRSVGDDTAIMSTVKADALVLDLRHASANDETAAAFGDALAKLERDDLVMVLVSPATPRALAAVLEKSGPRLLVLGTAEARPKPTVAIQTTADADRAAYDAFETGTPLEKLISGKIEKERYDEATLVAEFKSGQALPVSEDPPATAAPPTPTPAQPESTAPAPSDASPTAPSTAAAAPAVSAEPAVAPPAPATDRVLQRAVHLHRSLLALRR